MTPIGNIYVGLLIDMTSVGGVALLVKPLLDPCFDQFVLFAMERRPAFCRHEPLMIGRKRHAVQQKALLWIARNNHRAIFPPFIKRSNESRRTPPLLFAAPWQLAQFESKIG